MYQALDSFNLLLPSSYVKFIDNDFFVDVYVISKDTGLIIDEKKLRANYVTYQNEKIYLKKLRLFSPIGLTDYISINVKSAYLQQNYYQGITKDNIRQVYQYLVNALKNVCYFSYETFLNSNLIDIDVKTDIVYKNQTELQDYFNNLYQTFGNTKHFEFYFQNRQISGIEFSKRSTKSYKKPYLKFYDKLTEQATRGKNFSFPYLKDNEVILRKEATIKNTTFFESVFKRQMQLTLINVLEFLTPKRIDNVIKVYQALYFDNKDIYLLKKNYQKRLIYLLNLKVNKLAFGYLRINEILQRQEKRLGVSGLSIDYNEFLDMFAVLYSDKKAFSVWKTRQKRHLKDLISKLNNER